jgi:hypothetical protein
MFARKKAATSTTDAVFGPEMSAIEKPTPPAPRPRPAPAPIDALPDDDDDDFGADAPQTESDAAMTQRVIESTSSVTPASDAIPEATARKPKAAAAKPRKKKATADAPAVEPATDAVSDEFTAAAAAETGAMPSVDADAKEVARLFGEADSDAPAPAPEPAPAPAPAPAVGKPKKPTKPAFEPMNVDVATDFADATVLLRGGKSEQTSRYRAYDFKDVCGDKGVDIFLAKSLSDHPPVKLASNVVFEAGRKEEEAAICEMLHPENAKRFAGALVAAMKKDEDESQAQNRPCFKVFLFLHVKPLLPANEKGGKFCDDLDNRALLIPIPRKLLTDLIKIAPPNTVHAGLVRANKPPNSKDTASPLYSFARLDIVGASGFAIIDANVKASSGGKKRKAPAPAPAAAASPASSIAGGDSDAGGDGESDDDATDDDAPMAPVVTPATPPRAASPPPPTLKRQRTAAPPKAKAASNGSSSGSSSTALVVADEAAAPSQAELLARSGARFVNPGSVFGWGIEFEMPIESFLFRERNGKTILYAFNDA